jgi:thiol:disulfide interchange protein DsbD
VEDSLANNQIVFIDFTAARCITCKANEQLVLSTAKVLDAFKQRQVVTLKADWTTGDKHVGAALKRYGGAAVPYYVIISPDKASEPKILPTILTPSLVVNAITGQNQ